MADLLILSKGILLAFVLALPFLWVWVNRRRFKNKDDSLSYTIVNSILGIIEIPLMILVAAWVIVILGGAGSCHGSSSCGDSGLALYLLTLIIGFPLLILYLVLSLLPVGNKKVRNLPWWVPGLALAAIILGITYFIG